MLSTCPNCKRQIEHEDFLFEVACECGMRFNPFYDSNSASETNNEDPGTGGGGGTGGTGTGETDAGDGFSESRAAFEDIVRFGETSEDAAENTDVTPDLSTAQEGAEAIPPAPTAGRPRAKVSLGSGPIMLNSDTGDGLPIEGYLPPVSAWALIDPAKENPLSEGFDSLWQQCQKAGGDALVSLRWAFSPDGANCLLTAIPVRCTKNP